MGSLKQPKAYLNLFSRFPGSKLRTILKWATRATFKVRRRNVNSQEEGVSDCDSHCDKENKNTYWQLTTALIMAPHPLSFYMLLESEAASACTRVTAHVCLRVLSCVCVVSTYMSRFKQMGDSWHSLSIRKIQNKKTSCTNHLCTVSSFCHSLRCTLSFHSLKPG